MKFRNVMLGTRAYWGRASQKTSRVDTLTERLSDLQQQLPKAVA